MINHLNRWYEIKIQKMVKSIVATINREGINKKKVKYAIKNTKRGDLQDGGPVKCGDHLPLRKYIKMHLHVEQLQNTY